MTLLRACLLAASCLMPALTLAQWQWVDPQGRRVFSDQAPPPEIPAKNILRQPETKGQPANPVAEAAVPAAAPAAAARPAASAPKVTGKDPQLEQKKKQAEAAEAERKKAADEALAATQAENCRLAKRAKATLDSGVRVSQVNDKGEREFMDDKQRAAEQKRAEAVIARDCAAAQ
jgi:hypothetical protein